ncbi:hypothetical protein [Pseudonocardia sp. ICBG601]|uniref:hypothetical protein n=1 Tax=Pseudonocardia sp. ICBG601 TaxID=2846759 RepID=UPI001CF6FEBF|nr:hypothetical protein [Pseudonocardia sp. ICBG601]
MIPELDDTDTDTAVPALREWAQARLAYTGENPLEALPLTWAVYCRELRRGFPGPHAGEVLNWLAMLARSSGDDGWRRRIGEAVEEAVAAEPESVGPEYGDLIRAMLHDDPAAARRGASRGGVNGAACRTWHRRACRPPTSSGPRRRSPCCTRRSPSPTT